MPYVESFNEFAERQGCDYVPVESNPTTGRSGFIFLNAAFSTGREHSDPPDDEFERLARVCLYNEVQLQRAQNILDDIRSYISTQAEFCKLGAGPAPHPDSFDDLKNQLEKVRHLEGVVSELRQQRDAIDSLVQSTFRHEVQHDERKAAASDSIQKMRQILDSPELQRLQQSEADNAKDDTKKTAWAKGQYDGLLLAKLARSGFHIASVSLPLSDEFVKEYEHLLTNE